MHVPCGILDLEHPLISYLVMKLQYSNPNAAIWREKQNVYLKCLHYTPKPASMEDWIWTAKICPPSDGVVGIRS